MAELVENTHTSATAYKDFLNNQACNTLHVFVEGFNDPSFYGPFFSRYSESYPEPEFYDCGNKCKVLETRNLILDRKDPPKWSNTMILLYFVDKDLSDIIEESCAEHDVFVTEYYSTENYLVSSEMLKTVWVELINFYGQSKPDFAPVRKKFEEELDKFYDIMRRVMVWVIHHRCSGSHPDYNRIDLSALMEFDDNLDLICKLPDAESSLTQALDCSTGLTTGADSFEPEEAMIQGLEPKAYVVGKFELWFFREFVVSLVKFMKQMKNVEVSFHDNRLGGQNAVVVLGPRLRPPPESIVSFIERHISRSNTNV
ncbi:MAG: DUF4435 domain-containing protein [Chloroflexota bacterium]|nr:DUF4435 domain-containing protein [Chloroflexota bacterium]